MEKLVQAIEKQEVMLVFTYAPAGLGHLRVTDALYDGLPKNTNAVILGSHDKRIALWHRWLSITAPTRFLMERFQTGRLERLMTFVYRGVLRQQTGLIYSQMLTLLDQTLQKPSLVLIVATHFGLAHQLAEIKERLERERELKIFLVVQVTDDSPQKIWYVEGADLILVPSHLTREALLSFAKLERMKETEVVVLPYPVNMKMEKELSKTELEERKAQVDIEGEGEIKVMVPISGAAVGFGKIARLIKELRLKSTRFKFKVVSRYAIYTQPYIDTILGLSYVDTELSTSDREVVNKYDEVYQNEVIGLEITKPSEQTFKILMETNKRGGAVMCFMPPVGRQEWDNVAFLRRHELLPNQEEEIELWALAEADVQMGGELREKWHRRALHWRGVRLPDEPVKAASFIWWCLREGLFKQIVGNKTLVSKKDKFIGELGEDGVVKFWQLVADRVHKNR